MKKEQIMDFTRRISQSNRGGLVIVIYDIFFAYMEDTKEAHDNGEWENYKTALRNASKTISELISSLDFSYIQTVGTNLAKMHPASGFSAELAAAAVVMGASTMGLPVSSTHTLVGAVLGIGIVNRDTNWALMKPIGLAWVITLPAAASMSAISYLLLSNIF